MPANTTKKEAARLISEYRENEIRKKDPDLKRLQLLANSNRDPKTMNTRRLLIILLIVAVVAGVLLFKSCATSHDVGKQSIVSLKIVRSSNVTS